MKTVYVDLLAVEPFKYWRAASMAAAGVAVGLAAIPPRHNSLVAACVTMAIGWALCDVFAWRDLRKMQRSVILRDGFERGAQWAIMDHAYRMGNGFAVVGKDGPVEDRDKAIAEILADLFVPK